MTFLRWDDTRKEDQHGPERSRRTGSQRWTEKGTGYFICTVLRRITAPAAPLSSLAAARADAGSLLNPSCARSCVSTTRGRRADAGGYACPASRQYYVSSTCASRNVL